MERKGLGRGLSSLLGSPLADESAPRVVQAPIDEIRANPHQPRQEWDDESLDVLAESIRQNGVLQPLMVRGRPGDYELVAGERRLRAAKRAGLAQVPVILRETDDSGSLKLALIENLQREDISALDAAHAYQRLVEQFGMTQEEVSKAVGKSRPAIANTIRLLRLPEAIRASLQSREITEGHARALLAVEDSAEQERLWQLAKSGATVREIEAGGRRDKSPEPAGAAVQLRTTVQRANRHQPHLQALADQLRRALGVKVEFRGDENAGVLCLEYYSAEDLQSLVNLLLGVSE